MRDVGGSQESVKTLYIAYIRAAIEINNDLADGCQCTRAPGVPPVPVPEEFLIKMSSKVPSKKKAKMGGRSSKLASGGEQSATSLSFYHGYKKDTLKRFSLLHEEINKEHPAPGNPMALPRVETQFAPSDQAWGPNPNFQPVFLAGNSLEASSSAPNLEGNFVQQAMTSTNGIANLTPADPSIAFQPSDFSRDAVEPPSQSLSPGYSTLPHNVLPPGHSSSDMHNCTCGPTCTCDFCPLHPYNAATRQHLLHSARCMATQGYFHGNQQWDQAAVDQSGFTPGLDPIQGDSSLQQSNNDAEPTIHTGDYHMFIGHFTQAEIEAAYPAMNHGSHHDAMFMNP